MKKNIENSKTSILLLIVLVAFPQISETIFSPSLPSISKMFKISMSNAQLTMSVYFISFAIGVFFFGRISDRIGRRKAMLYGLLLYFIGNIFCLLSSNIELLLLARFVQAFGASVGSVITQTILRENYTGVERHKLFAKISAALAFTPAIGPLIGGSTDYYFGVRIVFLILVLMSIFIFIYAFICLSESNQMKLDSAPLLPILRRFMKNRRVWKYGILVGGINGIIFSYYSEAPFIFTQYFKLTSAMYGFLGIVVALASIAGAYLSKQLLDILVAEKIILLGLIIMIFGCFLVFVVNFLPEFLQLLMMIVSVFIVLFGMGISLPNSLSLALIDFQDVIGTASAIFSLGYYLFVSIIIYGMSVFHNGTIWAMPIYFFIIGVIMFLSSYTLVDHTSKHKKSSYI